MVEQNTLDNLFNEWLEKRTNEANCDPSLSIKDNWCNPEDAAILYGDKIQRLFKFAFEAGFNAKLRYSAEENLQK